MHMTWPQIVRQGAEVQWHRRAQPHGTGGVIQHFVARQRVQQHRQTAVILHEPRSGRWQSRRITARFVGTDGVGSWSKEKQENEHQLLNKFLDKIMQDKASIKQNKMNHKINYNYLIGYIEL